MKRFTPLQKGLLCSLFILFYSHAFAQKPILSKDFSFSVGEKYKRVKNFTTYYVASGKSMVSIKKGSSDMTIHRYSLDDLKEDVKKRQILEDKGDFETVMKFGSKALIFYSVQKKAYAMVVSLTGKVVGKPIQLISENEDIHRDFGFKGTTGFDAGGRINRFVFKKSKDEKKLLSLYRIPTPDSKPDKIGIAVYDEELELLWKRKVEMPYASEKMQNESFGIDNDGNFYMTASVFSSEANTKDKIENNYHTEFIKITPFVKELTSNKLEIPGNTITDAIIDLDGAGQVKVSGIYSKNNNKKEAAGLFTASIDSTGAVAALSHSDLANDFVANLSKVRDSRIADGRIKDKELKDLEKLRVNNVIYGGEGSATIFAEQRYAESFTTSSSSGSRTTYKYYYRDIYAFKLSPKNNILWEVKLPKNQKGTYSKRSMSYFNFAKGRNHYLLFVDDFENLKKSIDDLPVKYYDGKKEFLYLMTYVIDDITGEARKEPVLTSSDIRGARLDAIELSKSAMLPSKDIIIEAYDGKKSNLLFKLKLDK